MKCSSMPGRILPLRSTSQPKKMPHTSAVMLCARSRCSNANSRAGAKIATLLPLGRIMPCSAPRK